MLALVAVVLPAVIRARGDLAEPVLEKGAVDVLPIRVHHAPWYEWALLDAIGEKRAKALVRWVEENRPLATLEDLRRVPGLPRDWLERSRNHLTLD